MDLLNAGKTVMSLSKQLKVEVFYLEGGGDGAVLQCHVVVDNVESGTIM